MHVIRTRVNNINGNNKNNSSQKNHEKEKNGKKIRRRNAETEFVEKEKVLHFVVAITFILLILFMLFILCTHTHIHIQYNIFFLLLSLSSHIGWCDRERYGHINYTSNMCSML